MSTVEVGVQTMNKQSGNRVMSQNGQNKAKPMKGQLSEQDLNKASGGHAIGDTLQGHDTNGVPSPIVVPTHTDPFHKG